MDHGRVGAGEAGVEGRPDGDQPGQDYTHLRQIEAEYRPRSSNRKRGAVPREAANDGENVAHAQNQASLKPSSQLGSGTAPRFLMVQAYISLPSETAAYSVATGSGASSPWRALAGK